MQILVQSGEYLFHNRDRWGRILPEFDWDDLRVFLALHRGRSVRAASRALRVSHSTISRRIDGLEAAMGARLFDRLPSGFTPTPAGEAMLERAERVETDLLGLEREITGRDARLSGPIRVSLTPIVAQHLLMPHLAAFAGAYPDIEMRVSASYEIADLGRREADVAVRFSAQPDDHLVGRRLPDFADAAFATPDYVAAHRFEGPNAAARWIGWDDVEPIPNGCARGRIPIVGLAGRSPTRWGRSPRRGPGSGWPTCPASSATAIRSWSACRRVGSSAIGRAGS